MESGVNGADISGKNNESQMFEESAEIDGETGVGSRFPLVESFSCCICAGALLEAERRSLEYSLTCFFVCLL